MENQSTPTDSDIVARLSNREVIRNYCDFAGMHRAVIAKVLFRSLKEESPECRRSIGLEIAANFVGALEDAALWFYVLKEWKCNDAVLVFDLLDRIWITEGAGSKFSTQGALEQLDHWSRDDMRREFGIPTDGELRSQGWDDETAAMFEGGFVQALEKIRQALKLRTDDEGTIVASYNKIKHGVLAFATNEHSSIGVSIMIPSRRGQGDPVSRKRKVNVGWIPCDDGQLQILVNVTIHISNAIREILCSVYYFHFDKTWTPPSFPEVELGGIPEDFADRSVSTRQKEGNEKSLV